MDLGGSYSKWIQQQRKKIAEDVPSRQIKKKKRERERYSGSNLQHKRSLRDSHTKNCREKNGKG